jgi:predicted homoserine dehydrogenase-like protein
VLTIAKRPLRAGERLDGVGGYASYGLIDNHSAARAGNALPIALSEGCVLLRDIARDQVVTFADVRMPATRLSDELWQEQMRRWPGTAANQGEPRRAAGA